MGSGGATSGDASDASSGGAKVDGVYGSDATAADASVDISVGMDTQIDWLDNADANRESDWLDNADTGVNCRNLQCFQNNCKLAGCKMQPCPDGGTTSVSGVVFDPAGLNPLYNVIVYVPNTTVEDIPTGATCDACGKVSGEPVTSALTNSKGEFKLENVPVSDNVPIVIQVGKWRRQFAIPMPMNCADTRLEDRDQTRLPRNQTEGHLPRIALTTGGDDALECLLRKVGISESEMTPETGTGRINFYVGVGGTPRYKSTMNGGAAFTPATAFWDSADALNGYDIVLLSCEGAERSTNKSMLARAAMQDYTSAGGRVFASHWHNYWLEFGPAPFSTVAVFEHQADLPNPFTAAIDMTFHKGLALAEWLVHVGSMAPLGMLIIRGGKHTVNRQNDAVSQRWVYSASPVSTQYFSFNTPVGVPEDKQCGRIVFTDIHASNAASDTSTPTTAYPDGCNTTTLSDQEKALEFMLFDLSACLMSDVKPPTPPK